MNNLFYNFEFFLLKNSDLYKFSSYDVEFPVSNIKAHHAFCVSTRNYDCK